KANGMDLVERSTAVTTRHPWETARARAVRALLGRLKLERPRVLDVGCGDGYLLSELRQALDLSDAVGQDIHLSETIITQLAEPGITYVRQLSELEGRRFDLLLLLDVLEHVSEPHQMLEELRHRHLASQGRILITVPAFQRLFTEHDRALRHFRRYSRGQAARVAEQAGLRVQESGYLFCSLLRPRALAALREKVSPVPAARREIGVGSWRAPALVTRLLHQALCLDNRACLAAQRGGITLPGLSAWLLCSEQIGSA